MTGRRSSDSHASTAHIVSAFAALIIAVGMGHHGFAADDTADESRSINRQVLGLMNESKLAEATELAKKGLALCDGAGSVKAFCVGQFNELLGDIAYCQSRYVEALEYYQIALTE